MKDTFIIVTTVNFSFLTSYQSFFSQKFLNNDGNWSKKKDSLYSFLNFFCAILILNVP
jgi:hypothetical protein